LAECHHLAACDTARLALNRFKPGRQFCHDFASALSGDHRPIANFIARATAAEAKAGFHVNGANKYAGTFNHGLYLDISNGGGKSY
jgi:hypothetical protein